MKRNHTTATLQRQRGSALVLAIGLLGLFSMLAVGYLSSARTTLEAADYGVREARARELATAGVYAAIGDLRKVVLNGRMNDALGTTRYTFPTYGAINEGDGNPTLQVLENRKAEAEVALSDESGKVNLNHSPASVLQAVLGVDGATARAITSSLPSAGAPEGQWFLEPRDLVTRKFLTEEQFSKIDSALITTYTVTDHARPEKFLNINQASPKVLSAVFGAPQDLAQIAYDKRPYTTLDGVLAALGKAPLAPPADPAATPGIVAPPAEPSVPAAVAAAVAFESYCFRVTSNATYASTGAPLPLGETHARVEAVVAFTEDGSYTIVHWSELPAAA